MENSLFDDLLQSLKEAKEISRAKRREFVEAAQGSLRLEGFILNDETKALQQRYVDGELTIQELIAATKIAAGLTL